MDLPPLKGGSTKQPQSRCVNLSIEKRIRKYEYRQRRKGGLGPKTKRTRTWTINPPKAEKNQPPRTGGEIPKINRVQEISAVQAVYRRMSPPTRIRSVYSTKEIDDKMEGLVYTRSARTTCAPKESLKGLAKKEC